MVASAENHIVKSRNNDRGRWRSHRYKPPTLIHAVGPPTYTIVLYIQPRRVDISSLRPTDLGSIASKLNVALGGRSVVAMTGSRSSQTR